MAGYKLPPVSPGPKTLRFSDYLDSAKELGCSIAAIRAVSDVESMGEGFLMDGRPKILFEAHRFSALTGHRYDASNPNISSVKWNRKLYKGGVGEYSRLQEALALDSNAALKSASWGRFQIMGDNHQLCGFATVESFVEAQFKSENEHLDAFVSFVRARKLDQHLRALDWASFARGYNGKSYAQNKYDVKMAAAYRKYSSPTA